MLTNYNEPADFTYAITALLPTWADHAGYEEDEGQIANAMVSGYPRLSYIYLCNCKVRPRITLTRARR